MVFLIYHDQEKLLLMTVAWHYKGNDIKMLQEGKNLDFRLPSVAQKTSVLKFPNISSVEAFRCVTSCFIYGHFTSVMPKWSVQPKSTTLVSGVAQIIGLAFEATNPVSLLPCVFLKITDFIFL